MTFIRVQHKGTKHKYDAPEALVALSPDQYDVLDKEPVKAQRPIELYVPRKKASSASKGAAKSVEGETPGTTDTATNKE
jgi:hypothetical protein